MRYSSPIQTILAVIGFFVVFSIFISIFSGLLFFALKIILPIALIIWLIRSISGDTSRNRRYYR